MMKRWISSGMKYYKLIGVGEKNAVTVFTDTNHKIETDLPKVMGGSDMAPQPVEHLLAAFIGCTQATAVFVGRNMKPRRLNISQMKFDIQACRDERGSLGGTLPIDNDSTLPDFPSRIKLVTGIIEVMLKNNEPIAKKELMLLEKHVEARCPVANMMLSSGCIFQIKWVDGNNKVRSHLI